MLLSLFREQRIKLFSHTELEKELLSVVVEDTSAGFRLNHKSGQHDDHVVALAMACLESSKISEGDTLTLGRKRYYDTDEFFPDDKPAVHL